MRANSVLGFHIFILYLEGRQTWLTILRRSFFKNNLLIGWSSRVASQTKRSDNLNNGQFGKKKVYVVAEKYRQIGERRALQ